MTISEFYEMAQKKLEGQFTHYTLDIQYNMGDQHVSLVFRVGGFLAGARFSFKELESSNFHLLELAIDNLIAEFFG